MHQHLHRSQRRDAASSTHASRAAAADGATVAARAGRWLLTTATVDATPSSQAASAVATAAAAATAEPTAESAASSVAAAGATGGAAPAAAACSARRLLSAPSPASPAG